MKKKKRLLWQIFLSYLVITFTALASVTWYAQSSLTAWYLEQKSADLEVNALLLEKHILENLEDEKTKTIDALCKKIGRRASTRITVILPAGEVIGAPGRTGLRMFCNDLGRDTVTRPHGEYAGISRRSHAEAGYKTSPAG